MLQLPKIIRKTLSARISLMVVGAIAILLMASMAVMLYYSRKAVKEETIQKATQTLESTVQRLDNMLLSVEQATGNTYFNMLYDLNNPKKMFTYAEELVKANPYIAGCAIAFKKDYCKDCEHFMAYVRRGDSSGIPYASSEIVRVDSFGNKPYWQQFWFTKPLKTGRPEWLNPLTGMKDISEAPIFTFSLPIISADGKPIGVLAADISLSLLSGIVSEGKPSKNSYCALIDSEGTFIVHPNGKKLMNKTAVMLNEQSAKDAANAMISGTTGYKPFTLGGSDFYVFYKPFKRNFIPGRSIEELKWSAGIIYPADDIFGNYNNLTYYVLGITLAGLLLLFVLCRTFIHYQLKPLLMLTEQAQHIARGNYNIPIPESHREDEIGRLQDNFSLMQQSLAANIGELEQLTTTLQEHGKELHRAYNKAQQADRMKTAFLHNMTNQMIEPTEAISKDVEALCSINGKAQQDAAQLTEDIQQKGNTIADLLKNLIHVSEEDLRKEDAHD